MRDQTDHFNAPRRYPPRKPKTKSQRGRGGDHRTPRFRVQQAQIDARVYQLYADGFDYGQIAATLGRNEDAVRIAHRRAIQSQQVATVEQARTEQIVRIRSRRAILSVEIAKRRAMVGNDPKKMIDAGELRSLLEAARAEDIRESKLMGLDSPAKLAIGWAGMKQDDLLTVEQLDNLTDDELRTLHDLLSKARKGRPAIEAESSPVGNSNGAE